MTIIKPPRLRSGNLIGLIAPASTPSSDNAIEHGAAYLERLGYRVTFGKHIRKMHGYLAGTDEERAEDFNAMVRDDQVKAIFAIRGGYGTPRLLQMIDYRSLKRHPKILVGYSDITALQLAIFRTIGLVTFSGPMTGVEMSKGIDPYTEEHFWRLLTSTKKIGALKNPADEPLSFLNNGSARGRLLGGNFSLVACLMGTPFIPTLRKSILVLEDVDEPPHRIDRMFAQLLHSGIGKNLAGLICGKFTHCHPGDPNEPHLAVEEYAAKLTCPVITNFSYGHIPRKLTIPIGLQTRIDTNRKLIDVLESAVV
jgi:muramoyltetrapeptide carboxypeptidase